MVTPADTRTTALGRGARRAALLVAGGLAGCVARPATQLVVHVDTDLAQGTALVGYHIRIRHDDDGSTVSDVDYSLLPGATARNFLPAELGVLAHDRTDPRRLDVDVTAELADPADNFTVRAVVGFRADHAERLDVFLARQCADPAARPMCAASQTCERGVVCVPTVRSMLPDYVPDVASNDAAETSDGPADVVPDAPSFEAGDAARDVSGTADTGGDGSWHVTSGFGTLRDSVLTAGSLRLVGVNFEWGAQACVGSRCVTGGVTP